MSATLPPAITSHVQASLRIPCLTLLTTGLETPANWLVIGFIHAALKGLESDHPNKSSSTNRDCPVVFVSIWRSLQFWTETARKSNLDLPASIRNKSLCYIDGLSATTASQPKAINLQGLTLSHLSDAITSGTNGLAAGMPSTSTKVLVIDGLDFLLAASPGPGPDLIMTRRFILEMQSKFTNVVLSCAADNALLHNIDAASTPLEIQHGALLRSLAHSSQFVFQLRPLETGHAKDVTGSLRISQGGAYEAVSEAADEGEWLYKVNADGTVKVWQRGA